MTETVTDPVAPAGPSEAAVRDEAGSAKTTLLPLGVVVGMHRSGTSVITKGLECLGFDLGSQLMPAHAEVNAKGFFEDERLVAINDRVLEKAGGLWRRPFRLDFSEVEGDPFQEERLEAAAILARELRHGGRFAFKDPRSSVTLPFWKAVFKAMGTEEGYVIAIRNPLAAARSLDKPHRIPPLKGILLWAQHFLDSMAETEGRPRLVVSYERFVERPEAELSRMGTVLGQSPDVPVSATEKFVRDFVDPTLKRQNIPYEELRRSRQVPSFALDLYDLASALGDDEDVPDLDARLAEARRALDGYGPLLDLDDERDRRMEEMHQRLVAAEFLEAHVRHLEQVAHQRLTTMQAEQARVHEKEQALSALRNELTERSEALTQQSRAASLWKARADRLQHVVLQRDQARAALEGSAAAEPHLRAHITELEAAVARAHAEAVRAQEVAHALQKTVSWRLTSPLRRLSLLLRRTPRPLHASATGRLAKAVIGYTEQVPAATPQPIKPAAQSIVHAKPAVAVVLSADNARSLSEAVVRLHADGMRAKLFVCVPYGEGEAATRVLGCHNLAYRVDEREDKRMFAAHFADILEEAASTGWQYIAGIDAQADVPALSPLVDHLEANPTIAAIARVGTADAPALPEAYAEPLRRSGAEGAGPAFAAPFVSRIDVLDPLRSAALTSVDLASDDGEALAAAMMRALAELPASRALSVQEIGPSADR
ncbi:MAG: hypothetical protein V2I43_24925 [Parvularcula sp.]|jgi:hypothetical protein|nr:hypothetical protein [Parvularcula sp.]